MISKNAIDGMAYAFSFGMEVECNVVRSISISIVCVIICTKFFLNPEYTFLPR